MTISTKAGWITRAIGLAFRILKLFQWVPLLIARVSVGAVFVQSGWGKLHNLPKVIGFFTELGIPHPELQAPMVATFEFVCGLALVLGLGTRMAAASLSVIMVVALKTAKSSDIDSLVTLFGLSEFQFIVVCLVLIFFGAGNFSVDALLKKSGMLPQFT